MLAPNPYFAACPTRVVLDRIGERWAGLILGLLAEEPRRFNRLRREIEGISQKMLSQTLKGLERDGLVSRTVIPSTPVTVEYALTELGRTLAVEIEGLRRWAEDNIDRVVEAQRRYDARAA